MAKTNKYTTSVVITTNLPVTKKELKQAVWCGLEGRDVYRAATARGHGEHARITKVTVRSVDID
jgi:hypothetical protein